MRKQPLYNDSDIGYCDPEWMEIEKVISEEIIQELESINKEINEFEEELIEDEE